MARKRLSMRKTREILRLKWALGRSHREVRDALRVSLGVVSAAVRRAEAAGLSWESVEEMEEAALEVRLYGPASSGGSRPPPECSWIHRERKKAGVTLELLHLEYLEEHPDGYRYTQFCEVYRKWLKTRGLSMRQVHRAGEKVFVDYSGKRPHLTDPRTGEWVEVELFVAVLGASNYTFAEATRTQRLSDFVGSHVRAFEYFGGAPEVVVPDQLKSAVSVSGRYEPVLNRTYEETARHYGSTVIPARPKSPKDKAKVEVAVQVAQRWILARMRNETFFSLGALNERIGELLEELNDRQMRLYQASRRELFEQLDRPALKPLPRARYVFAEWKVAKVSIDYHVALEGHFYSVPYQLVGERVEVRFTSTMVEAYRKGKRVAVHRRGVRRGAHTTIPEHMPKAHREHLEWTPSRIIAWAGKVGPSTEALVSVILEERPHPEQGYRTCLGILRLAKPYSEERLEAACLRAVALKARSYRHVKAILKNGLDRVPLPEAENESEEKQPIVDHENLRGGDYYH